MEITFREANDSDLPTILEMIANDQLGKSREEFQSPISETYLKAYEAIKKDRNQELMIAESGDKIVGTFQLSYLQYLTYKGGMRVQVEAVRVHESHRGAGVGQRMFEFIINKARERGAHMVQLTSDKRRDDALRFYGSLGFVASHEGFKLHL